MNKIHVFAKTKAEIESDCILWAEEIKKSFLPDLIVFIAKSGFLFAEPMAGYFNVAMVGIGVTRPGNDGKDTIRKFVPWMPQWLLFALLRSKVSYGYQEKNSEREVRINSILKTSFDWESYSNILIVDDSTDTGYSLIAAREAINALAPQSTIKTASYCVIDISEKRVCVDFSRYRNTIVVSATSRYSKENKEFMKRITDWQNNEGIL